MPKFTQSDVDFVNNTLAGIKDFSPYLSQQKAEIVSMDTTEDSIEVGCYTIRRYMGTETRSSVRGTFQVETEFFEVTVETVTGGTRWDPPDHDYVEIETCKSLGDALLAVICEEVRAHIRHGWEADAETKVMRELDLYHAEIAKAKALIDTPC